MSTTNKGRLILMPNTLDFGVDDSLDLREVLPQRVIDTAARLTHWAAENAKTTRALLKRVDAITPLAQPLQAVQIAELPRPPKGGKPAGDDSAAWRALLSPALSGHDVGLISEAGLPAVADPGARLVALAHEAGIEVVPLSGPSSLLLALAASGLNGQSFAFVGYLPVDASARMARARELEALSAKTQQTQLLIETPYRNEAMRQALVASLKPTTRLSISVGLTLPGGWTRTATVADWKRSGDALPDRIPAVFALLA
ncbi:SAM-dependent methyltransferase [Roseateles sp. BYS96W]|uniref:SAM-dependent methyltransferase n=1 Tax=Pelomonas nitida TaxID=3299027 RepID=A0ABW7G4P3_9BURK